MRGKCSLVYSGRLHASVVFVLSSMGAPCFLPLAGSFHDDLFCV